MRLRKQILLLLLLLLGKRHRKPILIPAPAPFLVRLWLRREETLR